jgi:glycine cleavage system H protein
MLLPEDLLYTKDHAWVRIEDDIAVVGVTEELLEMLDAVFEVDFPKKNDEVEMNVDCGLTLQYHGGMYDLPAPLTGRITKINNLLRHDLNILHLSCYKDGWLFEMEYDEPDEIGMLFDAEEYVNQGDEDGLTTV